MLTTTLAAIAALQVVGFGKDHEALLVVVKMNALPDWGRRC